MRLGLTQWASCALPLRRALQFSLGTTLVVGVLLVPSHSGPETAVAASSAVPVLRGPTAAVSAGAEARLVAVVRQRQADGSTRRLARHPVRLERRAGPRKPWRTVATKRTPSTAPFRAVFRVRPARSTQYRVVTLGATRAASAPRVVRVRSRVTGARVGSGDRWYLSGRVTPAWRAKPVDLERRTCPSCAWQRLRTASTATDSGYRVALPTARGRVHYRVRVPARPRLATAVSPARVVDEALRPGWGMPSWRDEFDGTTIDHDRWRVLDRDYVSYDVASLHARQATVRNGRLRLQAERVDPATDPYKRSWASAYLDTRDGKFSQRYGRFEISARIPTTPGDSRGLWPSFWLRDEAGPGEIDVLEAWGTPSSKPAEEDEENYVWTVHQSTDGGGARVGDWGRPTDAPPITNGFHRYAVEWTPSGLTFFFDDEVVGRVPQSQYPWLATSFPSSVNLRIHLAVGSRYWGNPDSSTKSPAVYEIEHVRVWAYSG